jgi:hypothetical protein
MLELLDRSQSTSSLADGIQKAWLMRWNQRIDESMMALAEIQVKEKWDLLSVDGIEMLPAGERREYYMESLLLKGAFLRAQGQEQKASSLLRKILLKNTELSDTQSFRLVFELGLDCWRREDIAQAMDYFLLAEKKARNIYEKIFSLSNILWCLESLDLNRSSIEEKLCSLMSEVNEKHDEKLIQNVKEQWLAYLMRKDFYGEMKVSGSKEESGQAKFFQLWVTELPYINQSDSKVQDLNSTYLWQSSYRMRTLAGIWSPMDRSVSRAGDAIDRLYLWVWKWMAIDEISTEKIIWTLESVLEQLEIESQSKENLLLLRNACSWIAILEPQLEGKLRKILTRMQKITGNFYPVLEAEFLLIQCLTQKDSADLIPSLERFPIFEKIFQKKFSLPRLEKRLSALDCLASKGNEAFYAVVDLASEKLFINGTGKSMKSAPLARLITLLNENTQVSFSSFEENPDSRRIYNLVDRLKKIFPKNSIGIANQEIIRGKNWPRVQILKSTDPVDLESHNITTEFSSHKLKFVGSEAHYQAARALLTDGFNRQALEKTLGISKATACRMIDGWLQEKWLKKNGSARSSHYSWTKKGMIK